MNNETLDETIPSLVRRLETNFISGVTLKSKYVSESLYEDINTTEAYINSKHISGDKDAQGRDKPFFNIVIASRNIRYRATDLDRKNIKVRATKARDTMVAFVATQLLQNWMKKANFGQFLNNWGLVSATYNEAVVKMVEQDGELKTIVVPWTKFICDSIDFENNPKIEILELTEAQLYQRPGYDKDQVESLCEARKARETVEKQRVDNKNDYIKLYEVHGSFPLSYLTGKEKDEDTYVQQMHVISYVAGKGKGENNDYTLYKGREEKDPYMLTALIPETDGSIGLNGAVKTLFNAQWMVNHSQKGIKDQLDLATKLIFQTSDGNFVGQNALTAIETGDILIHAPNEPLTQLANNSHDITALQNFGSQWQALAQNIASTPDALMGNNAPSGTAWRQVEALQQEALSLFELMTENKGLAVEKMFREYIIPHIKKRALAHSDEIVAILEAHDLKKIDTKYISNEATKLTNNDIVEMGIKYLEGNGQPPTPEIQDSLMQQHSANIQDQLNENGNTRFFVPDEATETQWKDIFKDLEWELDVDVTGEAKFNREDLATLQTVLSLSQNDPEMFKLIRDKMLTITGAISPLELQTVSKAPQPLAQPVGGQPVAGGLSA